MHPGVYLEGRTTIGAACEIHTGTRIVDSTLGDRVTVRNHCIITESSSRPRRCSGRSRTCGPRAT